MKIVLPGINHVFDCNEKTGINTVIIENQAQFFKIITDINAQLNGFDGAAVLSENEKIVKIDKQLELLVQFVPFDINKKQLVNKALSRLQQNSLDGENYLRTTGLIGDIERFCLDIAFELPGNIEFVKVNVENILKSVGLQFEENYESLAEKILDYIDLVTEYDRTKLFVIVNLRDYISDDEVELFLKDVTTRNFQVLMIESKERKLLVGEIRYIVDDNLCEIR